MVEKVLFVTPVAPWNQFGGTATVSRNLIALFSEACNIHVCCLGSGGRETPPGVTVLAGDVSGANRKLKTLFDFTPESFAARQFPKGAVRDGLASLIAAREPDFVIFDHVYSAWLVDLVGNPLTKVAYIAHDDMVAYADSLLGMQPGFSKRIRFKQLRAQYRTVQENILRRSDFTLSMTLEDAGRLRAVSRGPVEVAPLYFEFSREPREYRPNLRSLLVTGSFDTWEKKRGLIEFLDSVFAPLRMKLPDIRLTIAGRMSVEFQRQIVAREPALHVANGPSDSGMKEIIRQADAGAILDIQASGLKIKTVELAASGLPLASWPAGLEGAGLVDGGSCMAAGTASAFVANLEKLAGDADLRRRIGSAAQKAIGSNFSKNTARAKLERTRLFQALSQSGAVRST